MEAQHATGYSRCGRCSSGLKCLVSNKQHDGGHSAFPNIHKALDLLDLIQQTREKLDKLMKELDDLSTQVQDNDDVEASAVLLINGIAARIAAAGVDPAKLSALTSSLKGSADALAAAVAANTPAA